MQEKCIDTCSVVQRLEQLRAESQGTWADVARDLGLSESMLYQVKSGKRQLSPRSLHRLAQAERAAGLVPALKDQIEVAAPDTKADLIGSASLIELAELLGPKGVAILLDAKLDGFEALAQQFMHHAEGLHVSASRAAKLIEEGETKADLEYFVEAIKKDLPPFQQWLAALLSQIRESLHDRPAPDDPAS
jgi:transcriptional regulator with XRE-family HTH domain